MTKRHHFCALALAALVSNAVLAAESPNNIKSTAPADATAATAAAPASPSSAASTLSETDKVSYSIGVQMGSDFKQQDIQVNPTLFTQGVTDAQQNGPKLLTEEEVRNTLVNFQKTMIQKQQENQLKLSSKNLEEGNKFLEENKKKPGVTTLPSGLQYRVVQAGTGPKPTATDTVTTHYSGKFIDGKEFDSSYSRGEPAQFQVNAVIPGWTEALQLMQPGAKWEIVVPAKLGYGENGVGRVIGPNATLVFNIELLSINSKNKATEAPKNAPKKTTSKTTAPSSSTQKAASQSTTNKS
jgi:FKBP-type peptidyl-prolyl cis-trans isomerase FklB